MTIYNWLALFGIPTLIGGIIGAVIAWAKKTKAEIKALKLGIQALLRDRLLQGYRYFRDRGYATYEDRMNWENLYKQYHALGENGVMDDIRDKFLKLPTKAEEEN